MPHETEAGNVGASINAHLDHCFSGGPVQCRHGFHRRTQNLRRSFALFATSGDNAGADGLGQHKSVAGFRAGIGDLLSRFHDANHG